MANEYQELTGRAEALMRASQAVHKELCIWSVKASRLQVPMPRSLMNVIAHLTADLHNLDLELRELQQQ